MRILIATDAWRPQVNGVVSTLERMTQAANEFGARFEFRAEFRRGLGHPLKRRHHAVDLGPPGVGRDQDAHQAASARASSRSSSKGALSSTCAATMSLIGQCSTSNRPS